MNIAFDVDGVLADFTRGFCGVLDDLYGIKLDPNACKSWHWSDWADGLTKKMEDDAWDAIFSDPQYKDFWANISSFLSADAVRRINALSRQNILVFITNRSPSGQHANVLEVTRLWLRGQGLNAGRNVFLARSGEKGRRAQALGAQIAIEDNGDNCIDYLDNGIGVAMLKRPYNEGYVGQVEARGGRVVDTLDEFLDVCETISQVQEAWVRGEPSPAA